ncbi:hypothetical protein QFZ70_001041 [Arthrobacter sp. V1I9]|nr:hypothetical protein [Arthrobacter sp. V1I9]
MAVDLLWHSDRELKFPPCSYSRSREGRNGRSPPRQWRDGLLDKRGLALGVLLSLTGLLETGLLTLDDAGVT